MQLLLSLLASACAASAIVPNFTLSDSGPTIIDDPGYDVRDVSPPILFAGRWYLFATRIAVKVGPGGYRGNIGLWSTAEGSLAASWQFEGQVFNASQNDSEWDSTGVFTPGVVLDPSDNTWYLFYGGVGPHFRQACLRSMVNCSEWQGLATAPNPWGPWTRSPYNPVIRSTIGPPPLSTTQEWDFIRVDNPRPLITAAGERLVIVKAVANNFSAYLNLYIPQGPGFHPPFEPWVGNPMVAATAISPHGFENEEVFSDPSGAWLHMIGQRHVESGNVHLVTPVDGDLRTWTPVAVLATPIQEPAPIAMGTPGAGVRAPLGFTQFVGTPDPTAPGGSRLIVRLLNVTWSM